MFSQKPASSITLLVALQGWARDRVAAQHQRLELAHMSDRELTDLGIGRSEVAAWSRRSVQTARVGAAPEPGIR